MRLGEILVERGKLDPANLDRALKMQEGGSKEKLGVLLSQKPGSESTFLTALVSGQSRKVQPDPSF